MYQNSMSDIRPDPDSLLEAVQKSDQKQKRGKLKIFLGMAAGVGKTYAMLKAAQQQKAEGRNIVIGYVETHGRKETDALCQDLPVVPRKNISYRDMSLSEMDLDAVLARRPEIALVDELAHTNASGSRHLKRYQDVIELIDSGIDVYATLNVQHIESRSDIVQQITGATIHETVPDTIVDSAEIELVDISPNDLLKRLKEGKVYLAEKVGIAIQNFFRIGNLTALREIALRVAAERVGQDVRDYMQSKQIAGPWKTGHRLMVAISPSPFSENLIRWTRRLADSLECPWIALYVESSNVLSEESQIRISRHISLAKELGAEIRMTTDEDVVNGILRIARSQNVTQIIVGKPVINTWLDFFKGGSLLHKLIHRSGNIDVHVVRAEQNVSVKPWQFWRLPTESEKSQYLSALIVTAIVTIINLFIYPVVGPRSVALVFLFAVVGLAMFLGRGPILFAATLSALCWNFLFLPPRFTFYIRSFEDGMMFFMYFVVALAMGQLVGRIRARERTNLRREQQATALYLLTLELADATNLDDITKKACENIDRVFKADAAILLKVPSGYLSDKPLPGCTFTISEKEFSAASWAFQNDQPAGRFTDTLPVMEGMYVPLKTSNANLGILGIRFKNTSSLSLEQRNMLEAFVRHISLVLDRQRLRNSEFEAKLLSVSEKFSKTLLNSVSHELRTPVAAITTAASSLTTNHNPQTQKALIDELQVSATRLNRVIGNLLDIARLESGNIKANLDWCDVSDLIHSTLNELEAESSMHPTSVHVDPKVTLVKMNFGLMKQVLSNLILNAVSHTPSGTPVQITAQAEGTQIVISVSDRGPGLPDDAVDHIFEKFYRVPGSKTGGTGLGLSIVKGFVEVQGGRVTVQNRAGGGAVFSIYLPLEKVPEVHE